MTGSSTSWFPHEFITHLRTDIFGSETNKNLETEWSNKVPSVLHSAPPFVVYDGETFPSPSYQHDSSAIVVLTFEGSGGPVDVFFPINNFLVGRNKFTSANAEYSVWRQAPPCLHGFHVSISEIFWPSAMQVAFRPKGPEVDDSRRAF